MKPDFTVLSTFYPVSSVFVVFPILTQISTAVVCRPFFFRPDVVESVACFRMRSRFTLQRYSSCVLLYAVKILPCKIPRIFVDLLGRLP